MAGRNKEFLPGDIKTLKLRWEEYLTTNNLNTTQQREVIVDQFLRCHDHVSIDDLLARVRRRNKKIGYATVYRTLKLLVDGGLAHQMQLPDGQSRFEVDSEHHDHLICTECGLILEFENERIEALQEEIAKQLGGFTISRHRHELFGQCPKAQGVPGGSCPNED